MLALTTLFIGMTTNPKIHFWRYRRNRSDLKYAIPLDELAFQLNYHPRTLRKRIGKGKLRGWKIGGRWYVVPPAVEDRLKAAL